MTHADREEPADRRGHALAEVAVACRYGATLRQSDAGQSASELRTRRHNVSLATIDTPAVGALPIWPERRPYAWRKVIMKLLICALATLSVTAFPAVSFAQSGEPLTRAQVIAELIEVENAGFHPAYVDYRDYPGNLQAAEARIAAKRATVTPAPTSNGLLQ